MTADIPVHVEPDEQRWRAVATRDKSADGRFYYAVRTTGIFCKPSCPSRVPNRSNITLYDTIEGAESAGYRACKRCRPDAAQNEGAGAQAVTVAARMIEEAIAGECKAPRLDALAKKAGFSMFHFHRMFKNLLGVTPKAYEAAVRAGRVSVALTGGARVTDAIYDAGYSSSSRFYETATVRLGMAPRARRDGGYGETIRYAFGETTLGRVLVAETGRGVCAIQLGTRDADLVLELTQRFPRAALSIDEANLADRVAAVIALIEKPGPHQLPLDVRGTAFQEQVWQALRAISAGETATYTEIAVAVGRPRAVRAVAAACAANPTAVAIPCHRVVRSNGEVSGYRWGVARKAKLLARERKT